MSGSNFLQWMCQDIADVLSDITYWVLGGRDVQDGCASGQWAGHHGQCYIFNTALVLTLHFIK